MKNIFFYFICSFLIQVAANAQMKIGDNPTTLNSASLLELETTNKGLVFPRVSLTNVASSSPLPSGLLTGTVVYNTNTSVTNGNGAGLYVWGGTSWISISQNVTSYAWSLTGNSGTNPSLNFIGTTDNVGFHIRTKNIERMLIDSLGDVAIGSTSFNAYNREKLLVDYGNTTSHTIANFTGTIDDYFQVNIQNKSNGVNASSDFVATADDGTDSTFYIDMGINSSAFAPSVENWGGPHDGYLYANSRNLVIGAQANNSDVIFLLGGGKIRGNAVLRLSGPDGNIIVGKGEATNTPVGNLIRGPNATGTNITGGNLTLQGGSGTGTATGGSLNIYGGISASGSYGDINLNSNTNSATNINTGASGSNVTLGGLANNIILPKFASVGGLYYTSVATGQVSTTGSNMMWDSINNRLGIGTTSPGYKLSVLAVSNPLYLSGVQATSTFTSDSVLTINAGVVKKAPYSALTGSTTNTLTLSTNTLTSTVNGVAATSNAVSGVSNTSSANNLSTTVNGVTGSTVSIINSNTKTWTQSGGLTTTVNGISSNITPAGGTISNILGYNSSGTPVYQSLSGLNLSTAWNITGNTGTTAGTNFIGTTDAIDFVTKTNGTERMRVTSGGLVGIGTSNPSNTLSVLAASNPLYLSGVQATGSFSTDSVLTILNGIVKKTPYSSLPGLNAWVLTGNSGTTPGTNFIGTTDAKDLVFKTNASEVFRASSVGNFGIGTTSPSYKLSVISASNPLYLSGVQATGSFSTDSVLTILNGVVKKAPYSSLPGLTGWALMGNSGTTAGTNYVGTTDAQDLVFKTNASEVFRATTSGNLGIGTTTPTSILSASGESAQIFGMERNSTADGNNLTIQAGGSKSSVGNKNGGDLYLNSGFSSGTGSSNIYLQTTTAGVPGNNNNVQSTKMTILGSGNVGIGTTSPGYKLSVLAVSNPLYLSGVQATSTFTSDSVLTINAGVVKKAPYSALTGATTNTLTLSTNTLTSTVNGVAATSNAVSGVSNTSSANNLSTTVNGVTGSTVSIINSNTKTWTQSGGLTTTVNGISSNITPAGGTISNILGYNSSGTPVYQSLSGLNLSTAWNITGNTGTTAGTNFIGTTDAIDFVTKTNGTERMRVTSGGLVGIGTSNPSNTLSVLAASNPLYLSGVQATGSFSTDSVLTILNGIVKKAPYSSLPGGSSGWLLTGNSISSGNFLGTTNAQALVLKSNNVQMGYFDGNVSSLALGAGAINNSSDHNVAIGYNASTNNQYTMALGVSASATASQSTALGYSATSSNQYALALGYQATASGVRSVAIGNGNTPTASGAESIAIGFGTTSSSAQTTAIGYTAQATGNYNIGLGYDAQATGIADAIAIGRATRATQQYAAAIGYNAQATGTQSTAIGYNAQTSQSNTILLGSASIANLYVGIGTATPTAKLHIVGGTTSNYPLQMTGLPAGTAGTDNILTINTSGVVGYVTPSTLNGTYWNLNGNAAASGNFLGTTNTIPLQFKFNSTSAGYLDANNTSFGTSSGAASGTSNTAIGYSATASNSATAIGASAVASVINNVAVGNSALANSGSQATAIGASAQALFQNNVAVGYNALATISSQETVIGASAQAQGQSNVAIGYTAKANGSDKITVVGSTAQASFQNNTVLGYAATATTNNQSTAIGASALAQAQNATALGYNAKAQANNATAIGYNASTSQANALVLGDATSTVNVGIGTATPNTGAKLDVDGSFKLGDVGTVNKNVVNFSSTLGSTAIAAGTGGGIVLFGTVAFTASSTDVIVTIPSSANYLSSTQASVVVSPGFDLPTSVSIASARMISSSQVKIRFVNASTTAQTISGQLYITINEF